MKKSLVGFLILSAVAFIWIGASPSPADVTLIRTLDGELIPMKMLEDLNASFVEGDRFEKKETMYLAWLGLNRQIAGKISYPSVHDLFFYHHVLGQPRVATRNYTYLVANSALTTLYLESDSEKDRDERAVQNRQLLAGIGRQAKAGHEDAAWVVNKIKEVQGIDITQSIE